MDDIERKKLCYEMGQRLSMARKAAGLTQEGAADIGDTFQQSISEAEHGTLFHPPDVMYKLCQAYGISCDYLISGIQAEADFLNINRRAKKLNANQLTHFKGFVQHFFDALEID